MTLELGLNSSDFFVAGHGNSSSRCGHLYGQSCPGQRGRPLAGGLKSKATSPSYSTVSVQVFSSPQLSSRPTEEQVSPSHSAQPQLSASQIDVSTGQHQKLTDSAYSARGVGTALSRRRSYDRSSAKTCAPYLSQLQSICGIPRWSRRFSQAVH